MSNSYRLTYHLSPKNGWGNDPNGLVYSNGKYYICYQYSFEANGGLKFWKEIVTSDFIDYQDRGIVLKPNSEFDRSGAYSGCCFKKDDTFYYFYTGNVKLEGEGYDYIHSGRESNTILVTSKDGVHFDEHKEVVLTNHNYPENMSQHVRDPFVWEEDGSYYMILGARDNKDVGCILVYKSNDLHKWNFVRTMYSDAPFGYMWECPNYIHKDGKRFIICCPQGVDEVDYDYEAIYQNGYFELDGNIEEGELSSFKELDHGFDFYAPQIFKDEHDRLLMLGWMGLPDTDYTNPTVEAGWQHAYTLMRELTVKDGHLYQYPVEENKNLRMNEQTIKSKFMAFKSRSFELHITPNSDSFEYTLRGVGMTYENGLFTLDMNSRGSGRKLKHIKIPQIRDMEIFSDTSCLEIYFNGGEYCLSTRLYEKDMSINFASNEEVAMTVYDLKAISIDEQTQKTAGLYQLSNATSI